MGGAREPWEIGRWLLAGMVALAAVNAGSVRAEGEASDERRPLKLRLPASPPASHVATRVPASPVPKSASTGPSGITAHACMPCAAPGPEEPKPLLSALPAGESYEVRILKSAVSGFRMRASDAREPASSDERLRLRISRQQVSVAWQMSF